MGSIHLGIRLLKGKAQQNSPYVLLNQLYQTHIQIIPLNLLSMENQNQPSRLNLHILRANLQPEVIIHQQMGTILLHSKDILHNSKVTLPLQEVIL